MKKLLLPLSFLLAVVSAAAQDQVRPRVTGAIPRGEDSQSMSSRGRTVSTNDSGAAESPTANASKPIWGDSAIVPKVAPPVAVPTPGSVSTSLQTNTQATPRFVKPTSLDV